MKKEGDADPSSARAFFAAACLLFFACAIAAAEPLVLEIKEAKAASQDRTNEPIVRIVFTERSARAFAEFTGKNVGKTTEIRLDGKAVMKPVIREPILGGTVQISDRFTLQQVQEIVGRLSSGAGKLEVEVME
jgi:preprotein translocase subunit SecD